MPELTKEQMLELWRECGEAGTKDCNNCPVPKEKCEEWNEIRMDDAFVRFVLTGVRLG